MQASLVFGVGVLLAALAACRPPSAPPPSALPTSLSLSCAACHKAGDPLLEGRTEAALRARLRALREGGAGELVMPRIAKALSDEDIDALARHFGKAER